MGGMEYRAREDGSGERKKYMAMKKEEETERDRGMNRKREM